MKHKHQDRLTGSAIVDRDIWFDPKGRCHFTYDEKGRRPVNNTKPLNQTNRPTSCVVLRLHTKGVDQDSFFKQEQRVEYDYPNQQQQATLAESAVFLNDPLIWTSPSNNHLLLPPPQSFHCSRHHTGLVCTITNLNTYAGSVGVRFRFKLAVFYKGKVYVSDPTVINEPYVHDDEDNTIR